MRPECVRLECGHGACLTVPYLSLREIREGVI